MRVIETPTFDEEIARYWSILTSAQKESVVNMIKSFLEPPEAISIEDYNKELDEALARVEGGEFYTHEEVERMSKEW